MILEARAHGLVIDKGVFHEHRHVGALVIVQDNDKSRIVQIEPLGEFVPCVPPKRFEPFAVQQGEDGNVDAAFRMSGKHTERRFRLLPNVNGITNRKPHIGQQVGIHLSETL